MFEEPTTELLSKILSNHRLELLHLVVSACEGALADHQRSNALVAVILGLQRQSNQDERNQLVSGLACHSWWRELREHPALSPWLLPIGDPTESELHDELAIETEEEILEACRRNYASVLEQTNTNLEDKSAGTNLIYYICRSWLRARHSEEPLHTLPQPESFGMALVDSRGLAERATILGRLERGEIRINSVVLGVSAPIQQEITKPAGEGLANVLD